MNQVSWKYRRRYLIWVTAFTMFMMGYVAIFKSETSLAKTVIEMGFMALFGYTMAYVFGAVMDHRNARKALTDANSSDSDST